MKRWNGFIFVLIALIAAFIVMAPTEWQWTNVGKTWNVRPIQCPYANDTSWSFIPFTSDSDTGRWIERTAIREIDSLFITGHCDNAIKLEFWCCGYGDSSHWEVWWHYGNHRHNLIAEEVFDTLLASGETCHVYIDVLHRLDLKADTVDYEQTIYMFRHYLGRSNYAKWGSITMYDSIAVAAGDSTKWLLIEFDQ